MIPALLLAGFLAVAPQEATDAPKAASASENEMLRRLYFREPYSAIIRDANGNMRIEKLPFTKRLPDGSPDVDSWPARGLELTLELHDLRGDDVGRRAVDAGICTADRPPCVFTFTYLFSLKRAVTSGSPELVAVRYVVTKAGGESTESFLWGSDAESHDYIHERYGWRKVTSALEVHRLNQTVELMYLVHKSRLEALEASGRIVIDRKR